MRLLVAMLTLVLAACASGPTQPQPAPMPNVVADRSGTFSVALPEGFRLVERSLMMPDFKVYDVMQEEAGYASIYIGSQNASDFPLTAPEGTKPLTSGDNPKIAEIVYPDGKRRTIEYLWTVMDDPLPSEIHVWAQDMDADRQALADQIAASVRPLKPLLPSPAGSGTTPQ